MALGPLEPYLGAASRNVAAALGFGGQESPRVLAKRRDRLYGSLFSAALHLLIIVLFMWSGLMKPPGYTNAMLGGGRQDAYDGRAMTVEIVSLAQSNENGRDNLANASAVAPGGTADVLKTDKQADNGIWSAQTQPTQSDARSDQAGKGDAAAGASASPATAAAANGQPSLPPQTQGGDPDGSQNLLRQIARCLPVGVRPVIPFSKLYITLDDDGGLRLAPRMDRTPELESKALVKQADQVVQAALQCGPYKTSAGANRVFALAPDFSFLDAATSPTGH